MTLGPAQAGDIPQPTAEQLSKYFEARKILFRAPEYRKIETVAVTPAELGKWMEISDADIKAASTNTAAATPTPERRHVEQIVFPTMADAEAAEARIKDGLSFAALAAERGLKEQDIDLGTVTKSEIVDPAVADAAFALKDGEVSAPIKGRFGAVIVTVLKIEPEATKSLAELTPQIRSDIAVERAKAEVQSLHDKIEDERAGGASLAQAAEKLKLPVVTYDVDRSGRDPSGKVVNFPARRPGGQRRVRLRCRRRQRSDRRRRRLHLVQRRRHHAGARSHARRGQGPGRTALARRRDRVAAEDEIGRAARQAQEPARRSTRSPTPKGSRSKRPTSSRAARAKAACRAKVVAAVFHTAKDAFGSAEGDQPSDGSCSASPT